MCDTEFEALRMNGEGLLLVRLGEHGRFYAVDWRTSDQIVASLSYAPESAEVDATGYAGFLDAEFVWSKPMLAPVLWIRKTQHVRRLAPAETRRVLQAFSRP